ncbi:MAG: T9SS type A sorting domain-containing protein [Flavobacteriales bacterium]|nr:T9SS type A sorting domain-containing protein [Flavobacteriales bacterium]
MRIPFIRLLTFYFLPISFCHAQNNWQAMAGEIDHYIHTVYSDTVDGTLYVGGGQFRIFDGKPIRGIAHYNGIEWDSLGAGIDGLDTLNNPPRNTLGFCRYQGLLYVGGTFYSVGNVKAPRIATWDGNSWDSLSVQGFEIGVSGSVYDLCVYNDDLYVAGSFSTVAGLPGTEGIARWDGAQWSSVNFPQYTYFSQVYALAVYQGELYVGGNFHNNFTDPDQNIMRWDGTQWRTVGNGIRYAGWTWVADMVVYKDELYVGGLFGAANGNVCSNIQRWDGEAWKDVGGGTGGVNGQIIELFTGNGYLYAVGRFETAGGVPADHVARWDGNEWCSLGSDFDNSILVGTVYRDTLVVGGGFWTIDGDSIYGIAKWTGGDFVDECGTFSEIEEIETENSELTVYPNPANSSTTIAWRAHYYGNYRLNLYDASGRQLTVPVTEIAGGKWELDMSDLSSGVYFGQLTVGDMKRNFKVVKAP